MPELPEVENIRLGLAPLLGRRILAAELRRFDIVRPTVSSREAARKLLEGAVLARIERVGKQLALITNDDQALGVHLGMTGELALVHPNDPATKHEHARWIFEGGQALAFRDPRRFGELRATTLQEIFAMLGPDALAIDALSLISTCGRSLRPIKAALLDQHVLAGVGNIYADEALFASNIKPTRRCRALTNTEWECLAASIRRTLAQAIRHGGSTISDYRKPDGQAGSAQHSHLVYGRSGQRCVCCGKGLRTSQVAQRTTVWCGYCQR